MKKISLFLSVLAICITSLCADTINPTMISGGNGGWTTVLDSSRGLRLGLRARDQGGVTVLDNKDVYVAHNGSCMLEFSIASSHSLAPLDPTTGGYYKFYLKTEGKKPVILQPIYNWNDNWFLAPDGNQFQGPGSSYVVVANMVQGSHGVQNAGKYTLYAVPVGGVAQVLQVQIEFKLVK